MKLRQVQRRNPQPLRRRLKARADALKRIVVGKQPSAPAKLGGHMNIGVLAVGADTRLAQTAAIHIGRVPEGNAGPIRGIEDRTGRFVAHRAEIPAQLPAAQPDLADLITRLAQSPCFHVRSPLVRLSAWGAKAGSP